MTAANHPKGEEPVSFQLPQRHSSSRTDVRRARRLRNEMTEAELRLWMRLRGEQLGGYRFRRQVPVGPYVVDFVCLKARLVIEVDGGHHAEAAEQDNQRTAWLGLRGFRVLRFWNPDVLQQTEEVLESILTALAETGSLTLPTRRGNREPEVS